MLALDAMGGDYAPREIVLGAAAVAGPALKLSLTGNPDEIEKALAGADAGARKFIEVVEAPEVIGFDEEPAKAVRTKQNSSLVAACREVAQGRADGAVSAGNTGAMLAAAMLQLRRIPGLKRPGLCTILPTPGKPTIFIDVGANSEARPVHLQQFAIMAGIFTEEVLGVVNPSVGLVSIGEESVKGNELVLEAHALMAQSSQLNFYGNVEGRDIIRSVVDIVVTDGFTGNVCLKLMESTSSLIVEEIKRAARSSLLAKIGGALLKRRLNEFKKSIDTEEFGAAYLLGVRGLVVVCHGNSSRKAIASALLNAARASRQNLTGKLERRFARLEAVRRQ
ncbi:MAG: phosphate acyltransferase PlsX [Actinobacteria bacterium]|nr:phosphate acyltransferase PlsX [Actinomycetota bacterium]